jgi:hypothetical protein
MIIRSQQMASLSKVLRQDFVERMEAYLNRCFPEECQAIGKADVQNTIRYGIERAKRHDIDLERDVCKYIAIMFAFGRDFDSSPALPWASSILNDDTISNSTVKTERLFAAARQQSESPRS